MGNSHAVRYDTHMPRQPELSKLAARLVAKTGASVDFTIFSRCILGKFSSMPHQLIECLWLAFSNDLPGKVDVSDFITSLTVIHGNDRVLILRFLTRVYDVKQVGYLERARVEKILSLVYGDISKEYAMLDSLFHVSTMADKRSVGTRDLDAYTGPLDVLVSWIQTVLVAFTEPPSPRLLGLERRYASALESEEMMSRFNVDRTTCDQLRQLFHTKCISAVKAELPFDVWIDWCSSGGYISPGLASVLFRTKVGTYKNVWRFADFAEFCMIYGAGSNETKADAICGAFLSELFSGQAGQAGSLFNADNSTGIGGPTTPSLAAAPLSIRDFQWQMRRMFYLLVHTYIPSSNKAKAFSANASPGRDVPVKPGSLSLSASRSDLENTVASINLAAHKTTKSSVSPADYYTPLEDLAASMNPLPEAILDALVNIESSHANLGPQQKSYVELLAPYSELITLHADNLPALRELAMTACCLFGIRPPTPALEKAYVMGIMLRRQEEAPQSRADPYGPLHAEWCVLSKAWWDSWRLYVGQQRPKLTTPRKNASAMDEPAAPVPPSAIDNWAILKKSVSDRQLLHGTIVGHHLEVIPPQVYNAIHSWYGGGPKIMRRVISTAAGGTELELFPISLKICTCDQAGKANAVERELLFSKTSTLSDVANELCMFFGVERPRIRLWNMAMTSWQKQYILSPELTLISAGLQDGQTVLMEVSLPSGVWPRSQLHARLESELDAGKREEDKGKDDKKDAAREGRKNKASLNAGTVGLDNLGNTCYLNASLQVLMHTEPLMEYFLSQTHLKHINDSNKFGQGGRLALSFGRLANELWSTEKNSLSPKAFFAELTACRDQFAGHQQQDAHEFLEILLDRLSEDLNLVDDKPYIEQPDSDGRPDAELADIWWSNHFKRDSSIVQSLFAGQFKTVTTCGCGYSSDRYEVFTSLSLSIPEETHRVLCVHVLARYVPYSIQVHVIVLRDGDLASVVAALLAPTLDPPLQGLYPACAQDGDAAAETGASLPQPIFIGAQVVQSRVTALCTMSQRISTIKDTDFLFLFQLAQDALPPSQVPTKGDDEEDEEEDAESDDEDEDGVNSQQEMGNETTTKPPIHAEVDRKFIVFIQRKVQLHSSGAVDFFRMEPFGLPFVEEILPCRTILTGRQLYEMVHERVRIFFKSQPHVHARVNKTPTRTTPARAPGPGTVEELAGREFHKLSPFPPIQPQGAANGASGLSGQTRSTDAAGAVTLGLLASTDDLVGGTVPEFGFVLRRVAGGAQGGVMCSRCPWLSRCQGCVIPLGESGATVDMNSAVDLKDGESLAIDWHRIVFEELLDTAAAIEMRKHVPTNGASGGGAGGKPTETHLPLSCCLDKFTEEDRISDFVCPTCKSDDRMKRSFSLWRCPPILVVQLKRFQYDRTSRRKLNNRVDFPLNDLSMAKYLAKARLDSLGTDGQPPPLYDLFASIHHVGLLGGGHYVAAVRQAESNSRKDGANAKDGPQFSIYNDGLVTKLTDKNEVSSSSAYLLFYKRKDIELDQNNLLTPAASKLVSTLFPQGDGVDRSKAATAAPHQTMKAKIKNQFAKIKNQVRVSAETDVKDDEDNEMVPSTTSRGDCAIA